MRNAVAASHEATTLTITINHATTPNRGAVPAWVKRGSTHGESVATAKLYSSRQTATLIVPLGSRRSSSGAASWRPR
ncbi:hypothetical protein MAHJHV63_42530 [Mycobacterium avium subsp. hominissuis]